METTTNQQSYSLLQNTIN